MAVVVNVMVEGVAFLITSCGMGEASVNESLRTHRNTLGDIKTGERDCPGKSMADIYLLARRCPVQRRRDSHPGFRTELENLAGDGKGKGASATT